MKTYMKSVVLVTALAGPTFTQADPSFGFGVTLVFGGDVAAGVRVFSDDEPESAVLAIGADYKFGSGAIRPTVGAAYLDEDFYVDFSLGYDLGIGALDYGIGIGGAFDTEEESSGSPAPSTDGPT
ncbi:hypothetical protein J7400_10490 [Shimia sp. R9_2]|uniref:hypothetical protein n=1 Tax=Shimia sp. R9_2 TaxID=2821112 RepID=UPI001ADA3FA7|nr:hypothetical protein [Shimia sp. R9_2]MBO9397110.1 hypothetical protein [Shimia sp. R9_2]